MPLSLLASQFRSRLNSTPVSRNNARKASEFQRQIYTANNYVLLVNDPTDSDAACTRIPLLKINVNGLATLATSKPTKPLCLPRPSSHQHPTPYTHLITPTLSPHQRSSQTTQTPSANPYYPLQQLWQFG